MTYYIKSGNHFSPSPEASLDLHYALPVGNYIIKKDQYGNLFFEQIEQFSFTGKRYGDNERHTDRIINTFMDRDSSTGVLLSGEKGSGKSLLAKCLSMRAAELYIPTIIINSPYVGDAFNKLIQDIQQPCVVLFDEFEKVYNQVEQEAILTLLDGVFPSKKLFVFTCNDKWRIDTHMKNRPGRIYYLLEFTGLSVEFIEEYCNDNLLNKDHIEQICKMSLLFSEFNFDMLKAMCEELNRYNETPQEVMLMLNAKPEFSSEARYIIELKTDGNIINPCKLENSRWEGNPLRRNINIDYVERSTDDDLPDDWYTCKFTSAHLQKLDPSTGSYIFANEDGDVLTLIKEQVAVINYGYLL